MSAWLVYTNSFRGFAWPRVIFGDGTRPVISDGIKRVLWPGEPRLLTADEAAAVFAHTLTLDDLVRRYPPPRPKGDPAPTSPAPAKPRDGGGVARELEVA